MLAQLDTLGEKHLTDCIHIVLDAIRQGNCGNGVILELLPKLLFLASTADTVSIQRSTGAHRSAPYLIWAHCRRRSQPADQLDCARRPPGLERLTGAEFHTQVIQRLCSFRWPPSTVRPCRASVSYGHGART